MSIFTSHHAVPIKFTKDSWAILDAVEQSIKDKIEKYGTPLKEWGINIYRGVLTGCNDAFIIDGAKRAELIAADPKSDEIIRPILRGRDIKRYGYDFADKWLIALLPSRKYDINDFPAVKAWLESFGKKLEQSGSKYIDEQGQEQKCRKKTNNKWYETQDSIAYWNDFSKQKIAWASVGETYYSLIDKDMYLLDTNYFFACEHPEYFLAFLNSKLLTFWINSKDLKLGSGGAYRHYKYNIEQLSLPEFDEGLYLILRDYISQIIENNDQSYIPKIDQIVYKAYHLTEEEIAFIENAFSC